MTGSPGAPSRDAQAATLIAQVPRWYHSMELAEGVVTPGLFDLRPIVERLPWPEVAGRRCLDVGTSDGFLAFELERRGASEVLAADIPGHGDWDWEEGNSQLGVQYMRHVAGDRPAIGFEVARDLTGSAVQREEISVYDLSPERVGSFDVVTCGSLLLHLRDPLRALTAIRSVCAGSLLCTNQVELGRSIMHPRQPLVRLDGTSGITQWWLPNVAGHRQMLRAAGFEVQRESGLYGIPFGSGHPPRSRRPRWVAIGVVRRVLIGNDGVPHHAILARPR